MAMDEALVPMAQRLKIGRSNSRLLSDIKSKESTLQLVYDVLRRCPFFNAFLVTTDVQKSISKNFGLRQLSIIIPFDSRWILRSISLIWNHSGSYYISFRESMVNLLLKHHLNRKFLPSFVF
uniref:Uncharacterized protein n=1 Tax=Tanacetum cinerariifolium TaxID=118510 RepID=A0A699UMR5_TANCI|nr:hypothetical protein [Tanacetum cinerariifolium]